MRNEDRWLAFVEHHNSHRHFSISPRSTTDLALTFVPHVEMRGLTQTSSLAFREFRCCGTQFSTSYTFRSEKQHFTTSQRHSHSPPMRIAILGGGITGLTAAFYASRRFPDASITLFERTQRLGGIMGSIQARVGNTSIISDTGPRTIRANAPRAIVTLDLVTPPPLSCAAPPARLTNTPTQVHSLNLTPRMLLVRKRSPAASSRYVLSPRGHLLRIPTTAHLLPHALPTTPARPSFLSSCLPLLRDPLFSPLLPALLRDALHPRIQRPPGTPDQSVRAFVARRWGARVAEGLASAVVMGVWAGDPGRLSARACVPGLWEAETRGVGWGGVVGAVCKGVEEPVEEGLVGEVRSGEAGGVERELGMGEVSVYNFVGGMGALVGALEQAVRGRENVRVEVGGDVERIEACSGGVEIAVCF